MAKNQWNAASGNVKFSMGMGRKCLCRHGLKHFLLLKLQIWRWSQESGYLDCSQWMIQWATRLYHPSLFDLPTKWSNKLYKFPAISAGVYWTVWLEQIQKLTLKLLNHYSLLRFLRIGVCPSRGRCLHSTMCYEAGDMFIFGGVFES
jgi:hypothetical protein